jgi:hypothetical protein
MALEPDTGDISWHVYRRIGMSDRDHAGAIHGSHQSNVWKSQGDPGRRARGHDFTYSAWWGINGDVYIEDGKLKINEAALDALEIDLENPKTVTRNEHTFTPPDAQKWNVNGTKIMPANTPAATTP